MDNEKASPFSAAVFIVLKQFKYTEFTQNFENY